MRWGSAVTDVDFHVAYADAAAQAGDLAALESHARLAEAEADRLGHRLYQAIALRACGAMALLQEDAGEAVELHTRALEIFEALGTSYQIGRTLQERARAQRRLGELESARADLQQAISALDGLGARPAAELAREQLAGLDGG